MTGLQTRPVVRETTCRDQRTNKPIVIRLEVGGKLVRVKAKGDRSFYTVTVGQIWMLGAQNKAKDLRLERERAKQELRKRSQDGIASKLLTAMHRARTVSA